MDQSDYWRWSSDERKVAGLFFQDDDDDDKDDFNGEDDGDNDRSKKP